MGSKFNRIEFDYDSNDNVEYISFHINVDANETDPDWRIKKCSYDSSNRLIKVQKRIGRRSARTIGW